MDVLCRVERMTRMLKSEREEGNLGKFIKWKRKIGGEEIGYIIRQGGLRIRIERVNGKEI